MDWLLLAIVILVLFATLGGIIYLMIVYISVEDKNQAWFPKIVVVWSLLLAFSAVLLLPLDVANRGSPYVNDEIGKLGGEGLNMPFLWQLVLMAIVGNILLVIPFTIFYYEGWDPESKTCIGQGKAGVGYTCAALTMFLIIFFAVYFSVGTAEIPVVSYVVPMGSGGEMVKAETTDTTQEVPVSAFVFAVGLMAALGWFVFMIFAGFGLSALPMDLYNGFKNRPQAVNKSAYDDMKGQMCKEVGSLITMGKSISEGANSRKLNRQARKKAYDFKTRCTAVKEEWDKLHTAFEKGGESPFLTLARLLAILASFMISIAWVLHIILYNLTHIHPFLNSFFGYIDQFWSLAGIVVYLAFTLYLLWAAIKGVISVGSRIFIVEIHPMKPHATMMSSFLYNCFIIQLTAVVVTQFAAASFRGYAARTAVDSMFTVYLQNMPAIGWAFKYLQYGFLIFTGAGLVLIFLKGQCCGRN